MAKIHELLGLAATVAEDELKRVFRARIFQLHPDTGGATADAEKFSDLFTAMEVYRRGSVADPAMTVGGQAWRANGYPDAFTQDAWEYFMKMPASNPKFRKSRANPNKFTFG